MSFAYMPWYTGDYFRDTRHLSMMQHGAYLLMLAYCWDQRGPLPISEISVQHICQARSSEEQQAVRQVLGGFFTKMDDGWYNKRMADEIAKADQLSEVRRAGGLKSAKIRSARTRVKQSQKPILNSSSTQAEHELNSSSTQAGNPNTNTNTITNPNKNDTGAANPRGTQFVRKAVESCLDGVDPRHAKIGTLVTLGITDEEWQTAIDIAKERGKGFGYALGVAQHRRGDAERGQAERDDVFSAIYGKEKAKP
jgi:uncharacterized protein YdaU (DUF1376 family)